MGSATENRKINIYLNGKQVENNMKSIRASYAKANAQLNKMTIGSKAYIAQTKKVKQLKGLMDEHRTGIFGAQKAWVQLKGVMFSVLGANLIQSGFEKLIGIIPDLMNRVAGLSDVMADVQKTSGISKAEVRELNKEFGKFDTRTPRKELLALAVEGGRLNKKTVPELLSFVKVADQIKVSLGDDLGGNGNEAIKVVGKLTEQYQVGNQYQTQFGESMLKLGSGINAVSASGANQAGYQIDYMKRLSGVANQADLTAASIIGYAAASDEAGQNLEVAATTSSKVIVNMFKDTATYADIAGIKQKEFAQILANDSNEALLLFLKGLNGNNEGLGVMANKMEKLGLDGSRSITVLSALAANTENIRIKQEIANKAMDEGTSLTNEFNIKNENAAGQLEKLGKYMNRVWNNSKVMTGIESMIGWMYDLIKVPLSEKIEAERISMRSLELQIFDTNTSAQDRVKLIKQLQNKYPKYLGYLDAESVSNTQLKASLKLVNDELVNKIILQAKEEKIMAKAKEVASARDKQILSEKALREKLIKASETHNIPLKENLSLIEQSARMSEIFFRAWEKSGNTKVSLKNIAQEFQLGNTSISMATKNVEQLKTELRELTQDRSDFQKSVEPVDPSKWVHHDQAWKDAQEQTEELIVIGENLSEKEKDNLKKKWKDFEKKNKAARKAAGLGEFEKLEQEDEIQDIDLNEKSQLDQIFGEDKEFERQMEKLQEREFAKMELIKEIDALTHKELRAQKEKELVLRYQMAIEAAEKEGLDTADLKEGLDKAERELSAAKVQAVVEENIKYYNAMKEVASAYFEWQRAKNQALIDDSQRKADAQIEQVKAQVANDVFTQEQADEQIKIIKERARARETKIKQDQWRKERAASLIQVAINTAVAISRLAGNIPLIILAGATGALSAATILAQKEPEFAFGTNNAPGGEALVGEFGPEKVYLPKGSQVIPATETADLLSDEKNAQLNIGPDGALGGNTEVLAELRAIRSQFDRLPHVVTGDWRLDEFEKVKAKKIRSEKAGTLS
jgi:hypothetical protein